jgi:hypothetical protein
MVVCRLELIDLLSLLPSWLEHQASTTPITPPHETHLVAMCQRPPLVLG